MENEKPVVLIIMDGFGIGPENDSNAVYTANTPHLDDYKTRYPYTLLKASGLAAGLPDGQMGNSEVGHLNLGAGRIVYQSYTLINREIEQGGFFKNPEILRIIENSIHHKTDLHLMGLLSDGGVHSHIDHFKALLKLCKDMGQHRVFIHAALDGRDVPPRCAGKYVTDIEAYMAEIGTGSIATISGRYYAMDRDNRWERTQLAYKALVNGEGIPVDKALDAVTQGYGRGEDDEFIKPSIVVKNNAPLAKIKNGDNVIFVNFRPDRARQLTWSLTLEDFDDFERTEFPKIQFLCMCQYDESLDLPVAYPPQDLKKIFGEYLSENGIKQLRISETEKYAHVTFFFNGQKEEPFPDEERVLIPSPKVPTYNLKPEMSAFEIRDRLMALIKNRKAKVYICNFANCDMVGHTGVFDAAVQAVETVDSCVGSVVEKVLKNNGTAIITADHGNAEAMKDENGNPITAHTTYPVPFYLIGENFTGVKLRENGVLADVAPTILDILGLEKPIEMNGDSLIIHN